NATIILGEESEPQPDLVLRVRPEFGGRTRDRASQRGRTYVEGAPELVAEVAMSTRAIDLNQKRRDYRFAGVLEYLVVCIEEREVRWFHFAGRRSLRSDARGVYRSRVFPGLWLDSSALFAADAGQLLGTLQQGLDSPEHKTFAERLRNARV